MDKESKQMCALFFTIVKVGKGKHTHKDKPALCFLYPFKNGPLLMRVHYWWSACGGSNSCTFWRGCIGGAVFVGAITCCVIVGGTIIGSAFCTIIEGKIIGSIIDGGAIMSFAGTGVEDMVGVAMDLVMAKMEVEVVLVVVMVMMCSHTAMTVNSCIMVVLILLFV